MTIKIADEAAVGTLTEAGEQAYEVKVTIPGAEEGVDRDPKGPAVLAPGAEPPLQSTFLEEDAQQVAGGGGPLGLLGSMFRTTKRALDPTGAKTIGELIPDEALDQMFDAINDPSGARSAFSVDGFNLSNISSPDDVKSVIDRVGAMHTEASARLGRAPVTHEQTVQQAQELAESMGDVGLAKMILQREADGVFNAAQMNAARGFHVKVMEDTVDVAAKFLDNPSAQGLLELRHRMALASAVHANVRGAVAEGARALSANRIPASALDVPAGTGAQPARPAPSRDEALTGGLAQEEIQDLVQRGGGIQAGLAAARAILDANAAGSLGLTSRIARAVEGKDTVDAVTEAWLGGLVSSPDTWALALAGNATLAITRNFESFTGAAIRTIANRDLQHLADPFLFTFGQLQGAVTGLWLAGRTLRYGDQGMASKFTDGTMEPAITAKTFREQRIPFANDKTLGGAYRGAAQQIGRLPGGQLMEPAMLYGSGAIGRLVDFAGEYYFRIPFRVLSAEDQLFRSISYTGELYSGAMQYARDNAASSGRPVRELFQEAIENPEQVIPHVHMKSLAQAREDVLQNPGRDGVFGFLQTATNTPTGRILLKPIFPFMRVINNTMQWSWDRLPVVPQVADAMRAPGPDNRWNRVLGHGGEAARAEEIAKMVTGSTLLAMGWFSAQSGNFNGNVGENQSPKDRAGARLMGLQGNSVVFRQADGSDKQYDLNRLDPAAMLFLVSAMTNEAIAIAESDEERNSVVLTASLALRDVLADKSALGTMEDVLKVWGASEGTFDDRLNTFIASRVASFVPSWSAKIRRTADETPNISQGFADNPYDSQWLRLLSEIHNRATNRMPSAVSKAMGLKDNEALPDHVNLFGEPWKRPQGWPLEWASFVAVEEPKFSREQLNRVLPEHLHNVMDLRKIKMDDLSSDELAGAIATWGPHGELQRLGMPVGKRQRRWKGVKLSPWQHTFMTMYEGDRLFTAMLELITDPLYIDAPETADLDGSKQDLLKGLVRDVRSQVDLELAVHPDWVDVAEAAVLRDEVGFTGRAPIEPELPGLSPGDATTPDQAVERLLGGDTQ